MNNEASLIYSAEFSIDTRDKYCQTFLFIPHFERYIFEATLPENFNPNKQLNTE